MRNILILGTGGLASELTFYIEDNNSRVGDEDKINIRGYIDYEYNKEKYWKRYDYKAPILSDIDSYVPKKDEEVIIGIANVDFRNKMIDILLKKKAKIGSFVHNTVIISKNHKLGMGNIIFPYCIIEPHNTVGNYNILTSYSFISHDCVVGNGNFFSKAGIAGHVQIGDNNYFGIGSVIIPHTEIGNKNLIQAGMTVDRNVKDETTVFYRFKEKVMAIPK